MEDTPNKPTEKQYYVLSREDYEELRNIQLMLVAMALAVYNEMHRDNGDEKLILSRAEIHFFYMEISMQINDALNGTRRQNVMWPENGVWQ